MKVENMVKLKEEFDYKSLCRRLDIELDKLSAENERQRKYFNDEVERIRAEAQCRITEAERECKIKLEVDICCFEVTFASVKLICKGSKHSVFEFSYSIYILRG